MADHFDDDEALRGGDIDPRTLVTAGLVSELISDIHRLARGVETFAEALVATNSRGDELAERVEELADLRQRNRLLTIAALILGGAVLLALIAFIAIVLVFGSRLTNIAEGNAVNGRILVECTTPSPADGEQARDKADEVHECFEEGRSQQASAINIIANDVLDAAFCARTETDTDRIDDCFTARRNDRLNRPQER